MANVFGAFFFCEPAFSLRDCFGRMTSLACKQAMRDIVVNDEKKLTFPAVHKRVRRISSGYCVRRKEEK
jgi:hypothetical protein